MDELAEQQPAWVYGRTGQPAMELQNQDHLPNTAYTGGVGMGHPSCQVLDADLCFLWVEREVREEPRSRRPAGQDALGQKFPDPSFGSPSTSAQIEALRHRDLGAGRRAAGERVQSKAS